MRKKDKSKTLLEGNKEFFLSEAENFKSFKNENVKSIKNYLLEKKISVRRLYKIMNNYISIIDLGLSNLYNVKLACDKIKIKSKFVSSAEEINNSKALILPVGFSSNAKVEKIKVREADQKFY